jgi:hypothetical protein
MTVGSGARDPPAEARVLKSHRGRHDRLESVDIDF